MKYTKKLLAALVCIGALLAACGPPAQGGANGPSGRIVVAGSTTVTPIMLALSEAFGAANAGVSIEVQELGTSAGINATLQGVSDIAMASRPLSDDEQAQGLTPIPIAVDGVAVVVHEQNPVQSLTTQQIQAIFRGEITNWNQVGGSDASITVVSRVEGSGIRATFESFAGVQDEIEVGGRTLMASALFRGAIISPGTGGVIASVASNPGAIGYITTGLVGDELRAVAINGVHFSNETIADGSYIFANSFLIGVRQDISPIAQAFVDWIVSPEGQRVVAENDFVPVH